MEARLNVMETEFGQRLFPRFLTAAKSLTNAPLSGTIQELVKIRASQINGCAVCTDMHTKDALAAGELQDRLNLVAVWRETKAFTEPERAALALAEQATRIADTTGVDDDTWDMARKHFTDEELAALIAVIAIINAFNRFNVIVRAPAGDYQPGMYG
jgi:AhpD family alkylhydroperoxidase